jgi:hypothetical protein
VAIALNDEEIRWQDLVDNAVFQLIQDTSPTSTDFPWNIEMIGEIRENVRQWLVERLVICDEMSFYPYIKE